MAISGMAGMTRMTTGQDDLFFFSVAYLLRVGSASFPYTSNVEGELQTN